MSYLPMHVKVALRSHTGNTLQNKQPRAHCENSNKGGWETVILKPAPNTPGAVVIHSLRDGHNLQCDTTGETKFTNKNEGAWEIWRVEPKGNGQYFFVSHNGLTLQCNPDHSVRCVNSNRGGWETWTVEFVDEQQHLGREVYIRGHTGHTLQNQDPRPHCENRNKGGWEKMIIKHLGNRTVVIHSCRDGKNLQVLPDGSCQFENSNEGPWEKFTIEHDPDGRHHFFVSQHTGKTLQCGTNNEVRCVNNNRGGWEKWTLEH